MNKRFAATTELQRPYGAVTDEKELPTLPIFPIGGHEVQEHTGSGGNVYRCYWHGGCEPQWIVDEEKLAGD